MHRAPSTSLRLWRLCAVVACAAVVAAAAEDAYDLVARAEALAQEGALDASITTWRRALAAGTLEPQHVALVTHNLGFTLQRAGRLDEALAAYEVSGGASPSVIDSLVKASFILAQTGRPAEAGDVMARAVVATRGSDPELLLRLGWLRNNVRRFKDAATAYRDGLRSLLRAAGGSAAVAADASARDLAGRLLAGLGDALLNAKLPARAAVELTRALAYVGNGTTSPTAAGGAQPPPRLLLELLSSLALAKLETADWDGIEAVEGRLLRLARAHEAAREADAAVRARAPATAGEAVPPNALTPYSALFLPSVDPPLALAIARGIAARTEADAVAAASPRELLAAAGGAAADGGGARAPQPQPQPRRSRPPPLRLAYISRRFEDYPGTHLLQGVMRAHGRGGGGRANDGRSDDAPAATSNTTLSSTTEPAAVRLLCFASGRDDGSSARRSIREACHAFDDVSAASAAATAAAIMASRPHALIDYDGAHDYNNMRALALRRAAAEAADSSAAAAPALGGRVHATWLGFPGASGSGWQRRRVQHSGLDAGSREAAGAEGGGGAAPPSVEQCGWQVGIQRGWRPPHRDDGSAAAAAEPGTAPTADATTTTTTAANAAPHPAFDAAIVDAVISPPEWYAHGGASEALWLAGGSYQPQDPSQPLAAPRPQDDACPGEEQSWARVSARARLEQGLPVTAPPAPPYERWERHAAASSAAAARRPVVLSDFNRWSKIDSSVWGAWMEVLRGAPHAVLWAYGGGQSPRDDDAGEGHGRAAAAGHNISEPSPPPPPQPQQQQVHVDNLLREAAARGVHPSRIVWAAHAPRAAHLWRAVAADVMVDTAPYGAHTTAADGLYTGLPLITLPGERFASRVGASLLRASGGVAAAVGVAHSLREYVDAALALAWRPRTVAALRRRLHRRVTAACAAPRRSSRGWEAVGGGRRETCGGSDAEAGSGSAIADAAAPVRRAPLQHQADPRGSAADAWDPLYDAAAAAGRVERLARAAVEAASVARVGVGCPAWHIVAPAA